MKAWRATEGLSLEQAGRRIGRDLQQWQRWESAYSGGRNPTLKSLLAIAEAMRTDLPTLMADIYWPREDDLSTEMPAEE